MINLKSTNIIGTSDSLVLSVVKNFWLHSLNCNLFKRVCIIRRATSGPELSRTILHKTSVLSIWPQLAAEQNFVLSSLFLHNLPLNCEKCTKYTIRTKCNSSALCTNTPARLFHHCHRFYPSLIKVLKDEALVIPGWKKNGLHHFEYVIGKGDKLRRQWLSVLFFG